MLSTFSEYAKEVRTILCFGIDPMLGKVPCKDSYCIAHADERIAEYFFPIIDKLMEEHEIAAIKPNYAFFAQYEIEGLYALKTLVDRYQGKVPVILDGKRGDIGKTGEAYANEIYGFWKADATTVSPYMGEDSIKPFLREGKLVYLLCRTSNKGAADFQELELKNGKKLYEVVAEKAVSWNCGLVVGATSDAIKELVKQTKNKTPLLIPGVGSQGGDLEMVMKAIKDNPFIHRINASSSIAYAYEKSDKWPAGAALAEAQKLNETIRKYL